MSLTIDNLCSSQASRGAQGPGSKQQSKRDKPFDDGARLFEQLETIRSKNLNLAGLATTIKAKPKPVVNTTYKGQQTVFSQILCGLEDGSLHRMTPTGDEQKAFKNFKIYQFPDDDASLDAQNTIINRRITNRTELSGRNKQIPDGILRISPN